MRNSLRLAAPLALLAAVASRAAGDGESVVETWDRVHMAGAPAGYVHTTVRRTAGETPLVESAVRSRIEMKRMGQTTEIESAELTWETPEGALVKIDSTSKMSAQESRTVCTFADGKVAIEITVMGRTRRVEKALPPGIVGPIHAAERSAALAGTTGETISFLTFVTSFQDAVRSTSTSKGPETVTLHDGASAPLTRVETKMAMAAGAPVPMSPVAWIDAKGDPVKTYLLVSGIEIESYRVADEAAAKAEGGAKGPSPDLFEKTLIQEDGPIPVPRRLDEASIVVTRRRADADLPEFADAGHHVTAREDGSLSIRALRRTPGAGRQGVRPLAKAPADAAEFTGSSSVIQADAPEIAAVVKETVGGETNAWTAAQALERWVFESVTKKNMNVAFASALEVCRSREGDCTEHAVLLAALCRAAGIPARVVMGVEYLYGIWGGHAWNEVWIEGEWYPLDATNGLGFVDPLHLPMARMSMNDGGAAEFVQILGGLGNIDVDVVEVVRGGRRIAVDDPSLVASADGAYSNRVLGIAFRAPSGWVFDPPSARAGIQMKFMEIDGRTAAGKKAEIEIGVMDAPARLDWAKLLAEFGVDLATAKPAEVDGREARRIERSRDGRSEVRVAVAADGALFTFRLDRADGEPERAAFDAFLASVDFDVK